MIKVIRVVMVTSPSSTRLRLSTGLEGAIQGLGGSKEGSSEGLEGSRLSMRPLPARREGHGEETRGSGSDREVVSGLE